MVFFIIGICAGLDELILSFRFSADAALRCGVRRRPAGASAKGIFHHAGKGNQGSRRGGGRVRDHERRRFPARR